MKLSQLLPFALIDADTDVQGLAQDSRRVTAGCVFFAFRGHLQDGHNHIQHAVANGAAAVVCERPVSSCAVPCFCVPDAYEALLQAALRMYGSVLPHLCLVGITGTNGKTTTTHLVESVLASAGRCTGMVGTLGVRYADVSEAGSLTTPDVCTLMPLLQKMHARGVDAVVMEASSHALHQGRLNTLAFDVGVFTHLTQDHLDYHPDMEAYYQAKKTLFTQRLKPSGHAVVNVDHAYGQRLAQECAAQWTFSAQPGFSQARVHAKEVVADALGVRATVCWDGHAVKTVSPLKGAFNVENILAACAVGAALGLSPEAVAQGVANLHAVPGRMEPVCAQPLVLVDYAHTPDALEKALKASRMLGQGKLFAVFGCGGNRDVSKRPKMGHVAQVHADVCVVTSDNPRDENPETVIKDVLAGMQSGLPSVHVESDRARAVGYAVANASEGDTVLIAGKGHETYQEIQGVRTPFDDRVVAREQLYWALPWQVLAEAAQARVEGVSYVRHTHVSAWCSDSRQVLPLALFVALRGERFDGHAFAALAVGKGACAVVVDEEGWASLPALKVPVWVVKNTLRAWGAMARVVREHTGRPVVGVTGSNGKTTTKELIASALSVRGRVHKTYGNFNNEIGMPKTVFEWPQRAWCAVLEMGMNAPGEIARMAQDAQPDVALITCVAPAHVQGLGSVEGVAKAKGEMFAVLKPSGVAVINQDDPMVRSVCEPLLKGQQVLRFGTSQGVDFTMENYRVEQDGVGFVLCTPSGSAQVQLPLLGKHNAHNALGAAACAYALGLGADEIAEGLGRVVVPGGRQRVLKNVGIGVHVMDDTYNANPGSMKASLKCLKDIAGSNRTWAFLGDMFELGEQAAFWHAEVGAYAAQVGIDTLVAVGGFAAHMAEGACKHGGHAMVFEDVQNMVLQVLPVLQKGDWILVKGSRGMRMERVVEALVQAGKV